MKKKSSKKSRIKQINCLSCQGTLKIRAIGHINTLICQHCSATHFVDKSGEVSLVKSRLKAKGRKTKATPAIPLGSRGRLHGQKWEVIGYLKRQEQKYKYFWEEYLLFNPYKGYRWLTHYQGHWNYVHVLTTIPTEYNSGQNATYLGKNYPYYHEYLGENVAVAGEFYWEVTIGRVSKFTEYAKVPHILSKEVLYKQPNPTHDHDLQMLGTLGTLEEEHTVASSGFRAYSPLTGYIESKPTQTSKYTHTKKTKPKKQDKKSQAIEELWSLAEYIENSVIEKAFGLEGKLPKKFGKVINQPFKHKSYLKSMSLVGAVFSVALFLMTLTLESGMSPKLIYADHYTAANAAPMGYTRLEYTSNPFIIESRRGMVKFLASANVNNSWLEYDASLINEETGETYYFYNDIEYYHGRDSEGYWREGSQYNMMMMNRFPPGTYRLNIETLSNIPNTQFRFEVYEGILNWQYFWYAIFWGLLPLCIIWGMKYFHEHSRTAEEE